MVNTTTLFVIPLIFEDEISNPTYRKLKVYPKMKFGNIDFMSVYLILHDYGDPKRTAGSIVKARFRISILNADGLPSKQIGMDIVTLVSLHNDDKSFGGNSIGSKTKICEFIKGSDLGGKLIQSLDVNSPTERVLTDNAITIHCKIWIDGVLKHDVSNGGFAAKRFCTKVMDEAKIHCKKELAADLGRIFSESLMSDLKISTADTCFPAHKAILAGEYFSLCQRWLPLLLGTHMRDLGKLYSS